MAEAHSGIFSFEGNTPVVHPAAFIHPRATVIGRVVVGANVYIGPGAVLRGDWGEIRISEGANVQENCVVHMFPGVSVLLEAGAHVGHGAVIHGARVGPNALIGIHAVVMDHATIGEGAIVGALSFVPEETVVEARTIVVGNPAKKVRDVSDEMLTWKSLGTELYQGLPKACATSLRRVAPLQSEPDAWPSQARTYPTWSEFKGQKEKS